MAEPTTDLTSALPTPADAEPAGAGGRGGAFAAIGAVGTAFLASLCCIGPILFVTLGVGAGLASRFEPLQTVFTVITLVLLAIGFYVVYGRRPAARDGAACVREGNCDVPRHRTRDRIVLWVATVVALLLLTFPQWSKLLV
jgi:mercuric ion transport protein